jgi:hypothetical protein
MKVHSISRHVVAGFLLLLAAPSLFALEAVGTVRRLDSEQGVLVVFANGAERTLSIAKDVKILGADGTPLADGLAAKELKEGAEVTVTVERAGSSGPELRSLRLGRHAAPGGPGRGPAGGPPAITEKPTIGQKPLTEMTAEDRYKGEDGGLYGGGRNEPPEALLAAAQRQTAKIVPRDAEGKPAKDGKIGLVSISMSNATMEYSRFKQLADSDPAKSPRVAIVDCAQGGQAMAEWVDPQARPWAEADRRLAAAGVSPQQVQVIWVKLANKGPRGELAEHGRKLERDTAAVLRNAKARFPNVQIAYLASRIYAGYAGSALNPEPYAFEGAFAARWLIQDQLKGDPALQYDEANGPAIAPLALWGPYFWGDGVTPRKSDGLVWKREDLAGDGTHPSESGRQKVADLLLKFFKEDPLARTWFVGRQTGSPGQVR